MNTNYFTVSFLNYHDAEAHTQHGVVHVGIRKHFIKHLLISFLGLKAAQVPAGKVVGSKVPGIGALCHFWDDNMCYLIINKLYFKWIIECTLNTRNNVL